MVFVFWRSIVKRTIHDLNYYCLHSSSQVISRLSQSVKGHVLHDTYWNKFIGVRLQSWTCLITQGHTTCSPLRSCRSLNFSNSDGPFPCPDLIYKGSRIRLSYHFFFLLITIYEGFSKYLPILLLRKQKFKQQLDSHAVQVSFVPWKTSAAFTP